MSSRIDSVAGDAPSPSPAVPSAPVTYTDEQRTRAKQLHDERLQRWQEIRQAGSIDAWVRAALVAKGFKLDEPVPSSDGEKKAFKERRAAERLEKKGLLVLAREARRVGQIQHLGAGVHWDEYTDADKADIPDRDARREANGLPKLETAEQLAAAMGISISTLRWFTYQRPADTGTHYRRWSIPKRDGSQRTITAPKAGLMAAQRWALRNVFEKLAVHSSAHGFLPARSVASNAEVHAGADLILKVDIKDFFPTITWRRVKGLLRKAGMAEPVATLLSLLCCESPRAPMDFRGRTLWVATGPAALPQGAPTSPAITNAICLRMDLRLSALGRALGFTYTRYADDLTFSWRKTDSKKRGALGALMEGIKAILRSEGFTLHPKKTAVLRQSTCQRVTGLVVNAAGQAVPKARVPREVIRRLRAAIHNREKGRPGKEGENLAQLEGMAAWIFMTDPKKGGEFLARVRALAAKRPR